MKKLLLVLAFLALPVLAQAQTVQHQFNLGWTDNAANEDGIRVYRNGVKIIDLVGANLVSYTDTVTGVAGQQFCYEVAAFNAGGESAKSNTACGNIPVPPPPPPTVPNPPTGLKLSSITASTITIEWANANVDATGNKVVRNRAAAPNTENIANVAATATKLMQKNLRTATKYCYEVRAVRNGATSGSYGKVCGTTL